MTFSFAAVAFFCAFVEMGLCIGMFALWRRDRARYLIFWSSGFFAFGVGALLISLQNQIPDFLSIALAILSTTLSFVLFYAGICLYFKRRCAWIVCIIFFICIEVAFWLYFNFSYDASLRIYIYNTAQSIIMLAALVTALRKKRAMRRLSSELIIIVTLFLIIYSASIIGAPAYPISPNFLASGDFQVLLAFGTIIIHMAYSQAFANMHVFALNARITEALVDAQTKNRQKVELLGYIGHDLRAPLATISSYSALLLAKADEDQHQQLQTIQRNIKYQFDLIDELLEYAKSELEPLAVRSEPTDLHALVNDTVDYAVALCSQKNNRFELLAPDPLPFFVSVDGKRLQQVLLNLLSNASKFTADGFIELSISARCRAQECELQFTVRDSGIGIDLNGEVDIFDAFQQVQTQSGSTGLGLFIVQHVVLAMGGTLCVNSALGKGSTFSFQLTVPRVDMNFFKLTKKSTLTVAEDKSLRANVLLRDLDTSSLQQLEDFADQGRWSDIESWIEHRAENPALIHFLDQLRQLLNQFEFPSIASLARKMKTP